MTPFEPRWPWANRHLQSILPSILPRGRLRRRAAALLAASEELTLDCGDGVRLQAYRAVPRRSELASPRARPQDSVAILLHGWEGSADSYYILALANRLFELGVTVIRLNLRDHGQTHHLNEGIFHSCRLDEVCGAVAALQKLSAVPPWLIGFSLGGNFALRVAASEDARLGSLAGTIAISPVLHPDSAMRAMERGLPLYQRYFVKKWGASLRRKQQLWRPELVREEIFGYGDLRRMTDVLVAQHTEFAGIGAYLDGYAITGDRLATLKAPATLLAALDDPIIPAVDLARLARTPHLRVVTTEHGGHMGFLVSPFRPSWVNDFVVETMGI
ncbi:MAG TPA: alpha/beta fold hydrolase [Steroidobacteraceae bacterium]|nr:alpha/beta fold hydrolase [Steroidobacteraceae bacterium]